MKSMLKWVIEVGLPSLPLRECGLKSAEYIDKLAKALSLPLRECGLKSLLPHPLFPHPKKVTPLAGVWIEMVKIMLFACRWSSLPLRECGLKLCQLQEKLTVNMSLPLRECGLKFKDTVHIYCPTSHSPCGSVD